MRYAVSTEKHGLLLKPDNKWARDPNFEFVISGMSDTNIANDPLNHHSVSSYATFLHKSPVTMKSQMQQFVTVDVMSAELASAIECVQDMFFHV